MICAFTVKPVHSRETVLRDKGIMERSQQFQAGTRCLPDAASPITGGLGLSGSGNLRYHTGEPYGRLEREQGGGARGSISPELTDEPLNPPGNVMMPTNTTVVAAPQHDERLMKCLRYSRAVRVLAVLSGIMVIYGASAFTPMVLMLWGPISGYIASTFKLRAAYAFLYYYSLKVAWDVGWLISGGESWILVWVFLFIDTASLGLVCLFVRVLRTCTSAEVQRLRDPQTSWMSTFLLRRGRARSASDPDSTAVL